MSQFVIVDETSKAMVFGGNKSALKDAQQPAAPGIDLEQFRKLSRDMRKFIDNWDTISIDEFAHFSMRLDEMIDASPKGERVSNSDELAFAAAQEAVAYLDIGAGGYLDLGSDLPEEQLLALPKGRHMLGIIGTYGVDGYVPADSPKVGSEARAL